MLRVAKKRFLRGLISFYFAKVAIFAYKRGCFKTCVELLYLTTKWHLEGNVFRPTLL